jgi:hypothetical protein
MESFLKITKTCAKIEKSSFVDPGIRMVLPPGSGGILIRLVRGTDPYPSIIKQKSLEKP